MNIITVFAPRWSTKDLLVAAWKISDLNEVRVLAKHKDGTPYYPESFVVSGAFLQRYPIEKQPHGSFRVVPMADLIEEAEARKAVEDIEV